MRLPLPLPLLLPLLWAGCPDERAGGGAGGAGGTGGAGGAETEPGGARSDAPSPAAEPSSPSQAPAGAPPGPADPAAPAAPVAPPDRLEDAFDGIAIDAAAWAQVAAHDLRVAKVDLVDRAGGGRRLRLAADSIGTDDRTVKALGLRTRHIWPWTDTGGRRFSVRLDWNAQANGAYLTAALYLCPTVTDGHPEDEPDWFKWEYLGVPQDNLVRAVAARRTAGRREWLERFGWPEVRKGRPVGEVLVDVYVDGRTLVVREDGRELYRRTGEGLGFTAAAAYLVVTTHSNYFERAVLFDDFVTEPATAPGSGKATPAARKLP